MLTFTLNAVSGADMYAMRVWDAINTNIRYFKKFNGDRWEEAAHRTYVSALEHKDDNYNNITPYIKKLARTILKVKDVERPYNVYTEDGEISSLFYSLTDYINTEELDGTDEIKNAFKELYLLDTESFLKLKTLFLYSDTREIADLKEFRIKSDQLSREFFILVQKYGANIVFKALYEFFNELPRLCSPSGLVGIKEVVLKEANFSVLARLSDAPVIKDNKGSFHYIDKSNLTMDVNPDYIKWDIIGNSICDILRIDIAPLMNYIYEEIYVDQGVNTRHISWCGEKYRLTTPGGTTVLCLDREKFVSMVRTELILNLISNNINTIIALSPDNVYIKPTRAFQYNTIRLKLTTGKIVDLNVDIYTKKRKN